MKNYIYIAQSLDGYIAGPDGQLDWLDNISNPDQSDFGFSDFMNKVDALIMGRKTFEKVLGFGAWPYDKPVFVASSSNLIIPSELQGKAFQIQGTPKTMIKLLNEKGFLNLYIDGGSLIQSFLRDELINDLIVTTVPVILGEGISLFGYLPKKAELKLISSEVILNQLIKSHYKTTKA